jgi:hypothetical protein
LRPQLETSGNTVPALVIAAIGPSIDCIHPGEYRLRSTNHTNSHNDLAHTQPCTRSVSRSSGRSGRWAAKRRGDGLRAIRRKKVGQFMRDNWLSNRIVSYYDNLVDH